MAKLLTESLVHVMQAPPKSLDGTSDKKPNKETQEAIDELDSGKLKVDNKKFGDL